MWNVAQKGAPCVFLENLSLSSTAWKLVVPGKLLNPPHQGEMLPRTGRGKASLRVLRFLFFFFFLVVFLFFKIVMKLQTSI